MKDPNIIWDEQSARALPFVQNAFSDKRSGFGKIVDRQYPPGAVTEFKDHNGDWMIVVYTEAGPAKCPYSDCDGE